MDIFDKLTQKIIPFKVPFIRDSTETLHYLEQIRQNEVKNAGATAVTQYRTIIHGLSDDILEEFIEYCNELYVAEVKAVRLYNENIDWTLDDANERAQPAARNIHQTNQSSIVTKPSNT